MFVTNTIKAYFNGLEAGSYEHIIQLFDEKATIHSPLYGQMTAQSFYRSLFSSTSNSKISLKDIFLSIDNPASAVAFFTYNWILKDGTLINFECVDVFTFTEETKIAELKIIYDTHYIRGTFEAATLPK